MVNMFSFSFFNFLTPDEWRDKENFNYNRKSKYFSWTIQHCFSTMHTPFVSYWWLRQYKGQVITMNKKDKQVQMPLLIWLGTKYVQPPHVASHKYALHQNSRLKKKIKPNKHCLTSLSFTISKEEIFQLSTSRGTVQNERFQETKNSFTDMPTPNDRKEEQQT